MGYVRSGKIYRLVFTDEEMDGLEVRARSVPLGEFLDLVKLAELKGKKITPEDLEQIAKLFEGFAGALVSWNLEAPVHVEGCPEQDGCGCPVEPVPATLAGLHSQDIDFVLDIILAWVDAIGGVDAPKGLPSPNGSPSVEASIPMEPLLASR